LIDLHDARQEVCARLDTMFLGGGAYALPVRWIADAGGTPDQGDWIEAFRAGIEACRSQGGCLITTRLVREQVGLDPGVAAARATAFQVILERLGFAHESGRLEFRVPLEEAIARLEPSAAQALKAAAEGDPDSDPEDDACGFLLAWCDDKDWALPPEALQIGSCDGTDARNHAALPLLRRLGSAPQIVVEQWKLTV
jgi:hypothetical protein